MISIFKKPQTYLLLVLGLAMAYFVWMNPVLYEFTAINAENIVTVNLWWTYEIAGESQAVIPYPNYWLIGGFYGIVMAWVVALLTYAWPKVQLYSTLAFSAILLAYGIEIQMTYWVYQSKYYTSSVYHGEIYWGTFIFYVLAILAMLVALYIQKERRRG